ncbi:hypothetical protein FH972_024109 [Carpinus fangiana]|uniref:Peroxisomal targeting signal receptor n=1 Tax=Carpinus fangiana TaxID=176857 RepID=A0A5N6KXD5_9ROSI|nr:hypothetical protein FH972_024109 [Carpinus fangiana]
MPQAHLPTGDASSPSEASEAKSNPRPARRWGLGILQDELTDEVPGMFPPLVRAHVIAHLMNSPTGSVLLLSKFHKANAPLGMQNVPRRSSASSLPSSPYPQSEAMFRPLSETLARRPDIEEKKRTKDGKIILEPQPEDTANDPLNWTPFRRDLALLSLGIYCMLGGGMTPILAAGFNNVAADYDVSVAQVALTTGLYMLGLGVGSVIFSPTAIILGKRPIYLATSVMFVLSAVWCALSPNYASLVVARVFQGIAVSPVECLPSATIAEIFFLHERAYRLGIYTLLLLGGKNLVPLVSAAIIQSLGWRWVFWIVAIVVGFCGLLLFFFVPETFWDRTPRAHRSGSRHGSTTRIQKPSNPPTHNLHTDIAANAGADDLELHRIAEQKTISGALARRRNLKKAHFAAGESIDPEKDPRTEEAVEDAHHYARDATPRLVIDPPPDTANEPSLADIDRVASLVPSTPGSHHHIEDQAEASGPAQMSSQEYTEYYRGAPVKSYLQTLKPWDGCLGHDNWFKIAARPFVLFAYPAILWSAAVYMLSVGWLIVLSESVAEIFKSRDTYNFTSLQTGLVYISPFVGGVLGTAVAGKLSDVIVRAMSRRNGGVYEPEFRLVMAIPVAITTTVGLMGYGWSAQERDAWIVPTLFFGIISFGCCVGSTTAITFAVDSYRQYAGEALVTLNWSKNVFHGLVFSLFFNRWLEGDGAKKVFLAIGGIQLGIMFFTIPITAGNPLNQFTKHVQDDKSLQRDRLVGRGPGGVAEGFRTRQGGPAGDGLMDEFMQQPQLPQQPGHMPPPIASPMAMEQMRREFEGMHTSEPQRSGTPQQAHWAAEFDRSSPAPAQAGFDTADFQRYEHSNGLHAPATNPNMTAGYQRPMGGMGYGGAYGGGMYAGMGGMGMMQRSFGGMNANTAPMQPQQQQDKGKGRLVELDDKDWEAQFAQLSEQEQAAQQGSAMKTAEGEFDEAAMEEQLNDIDRSVPSSFLQKSTPLDAHDAFERAWAVAAEQMTNTRSDRRMADEENAWREHAGDFGDWDNFDSPMNVHLKDPELGGYMFEEENPFQNIANPFEEGVRIMDAGGNLSLAALAFEAAVQKDDSHIDAWTRLGAAQAQNEKEAPAIRALEQAVKLDPGNLDALMGLAVSYTNEGYDSTAYRTLERWLSTKYPSIVPTTDEPWNAADVGFTDRQQLHERVTNYFIEAAQLSPDASTMDPDVQVGLGVLFYGAEEYDKAVDCFSAALASNEAGSTTADAANQRPLLWNRLGATLANSGRSEEAISAYEKALELNPSFVRARYNLGVSCINIGCYAEAAQHLLGALAMHKVAEAEGREKAKKLVSEGGDGRGVDEKELDRIIRQNQSTNLYDTLRRLFGQMDRKDLADRVGNGVDVDSFRNEFDF